MIVTIIVTYNGVRWIEKCLRGLIESTTETKIVVIDNASTDNTVGLIKEKHHAIHLVESATNLGFARANNIGIRYALDQGADYIFLLNQDAWVEKNTIEKLLDVFKDEPDAGIAAPVHKNGSNTGLDLGFAGYVAPHVTPDFVSDLFYGKLKKNYKTNFVNAAAWLISRQCIEKVGGFDTSLFFHYGEDDNFCQRVRYHNFSICINTEASIYHDREDRLGKRPEVFEEQYDVITRKIRYANPFLPDEIINQQIHSLKTGYRRKILKYLLLLDFKTLKHLKKDTDGELDFFYTIAESRETYKTKGMGWINECAIGLQAMLSH